MEMMKPVFCRATNISCSLGLETGSVWNAVSRRQRGVQEMLQPGLSERKIWASALDDSQWQQIRHSIKEVSLSPFEQMAAWSVAQALQDAGVSKNERTLFILSSTKGNIEWLGLRPDERNRLSRSAALVADHVGLKGKRVVVSQACISGVTALILAQRALQTGRFNTAVVCGADRLSRFVLSGFGAFQALAPGFCKPFDADRAGINLGEAAATIVLSATRGEQPLAQILGASASNDANHISGPSRTGLELAQAIGNALAESQLDAASIGSVSAHGTATLYNDEMEAKAFAHAGLLHAPVHSLKGYVGHTLGAAGVLESAILIESLRRGLGIASAGFEELGVSEPLRISQSAAPIDAAFALKTASGFGGCNAAMIWGKV